MYIPWPGTYTLLGFEDWTIYVIICMIRRLVDSRKRVKYQNCTISSLSKQIKTRDRI